MRSYKPPGFLTRWLVVMLGLAGLISAIAVISDIAELNLFDRALAGDLPTMQEATDNDERQALIALAQMVAIVFTTVVFIAWTFRVYSNLEALGAKDLRYGRGWAIGAWFVPIGNLFIPKRIMNDVWRASDPSLESDSIAYKDERVSPLLTVWWIVFLLAAFAGRIALAMTSNAVELEALRRSTLAYIVSDSLLILDSVLAMLVVKKTSARQEARASALSIEDFHRNEGGDAL